MPKAFYFKRNEKIINFKFNFYYQKENKKGFMFFVVDAYQKLMLIWFVYQFYC